jgi:dihydroxyacetone kinase-like predicted kinase
MQKYSVEFVLALEDCDINNLRSSLSEFSDEFKVFERKESKEGRQIINVSLIAEDPTAIFDICSQFGRLRSVKVDEIMD